MTKMKKKYCWIVIICWCLNMNGQNLILNSSFEYNTNCPTQVDQFSLVKNWSNPSKSSPDYFYNCNGDTLDNKITVSVPFNFFGYKKAHSGRAYAGIALYSSDYFFREYIQTKLNSKLIADQLYKYSLWLSIADSSNYWVNGICFCFSDDNKLNTGNVDDGGEMLSCKNDGIWMQWNKSTINNKSWFKVEGVYKAIGNEEYLTIGIFKENNKKIKTKTIKKIKSYYRSYAYYYVDDMELVPISTK